MGPRGIEVVLGFTPQNRGITNSRDVADVLSLEVKVVLVFGLSFLLLIPPVLLFRWN